MTIISASCRLGNNPYVCGKLRHDELPMDSRVVVLVHGYNNSAEEAAGMYTVMHQKIAARKLPYDAIVDFDWPGSQTKLGFPFAVARADVAGLSGLYKLVRRLQNLHNEITLVSHSLGARVVLRAMQDLEIKIKHAILMAPAVDADCLSIDERTVLSGGGEFAEAADMAEKVTVLYSANDGVLKYAYWLSEFMDWQRGLTWSGALGRRGLPGVVRRHIHAVNCDDHARSHGAYAGDEEVYRIWEGVLDG